MTGVQLARQCDLPGCVRTGHGGGLRQPGVGTGEPGVLRDTGLSLRPRRASASAPRCRRMARSSSATTSRARPSSSRLAPACIRSMQPHAAPRLPKSTGSGCRGGGRGALPWHYSLSNRCSSQEQLRSVDNEPATLKDSNHSGRVKRPRTQKAALGNSTVTTANSNHPFSTQSAGRPMSGFETLAGARSSTTEGCALAPRPRSGDVRRVGRRGVPSRAFPGPRLLLPCASVSAPSPALGGESRALLRHAALSVVRDMRVADNCRRRPGLLPERASATVRSPHAGRQRSAARAGRRRRVDDGVSDAEGPAHPRRLQRRPGRPRSSGLSHPSAHARRAVSCAAVRPHSSRQRETGRRCLQ